MGDLKKVSHLFLSDNKSDIRFLKIKVSLYNEAYLISLQFRHTFSPSLTTQIV